MGCHYEFTSVDNEGGGELLASSEEHHRRVGLLARAMVHYSCCEPWRILYFLVPLLEHGDKQDKLTVMVSFVEDQDSILTSFSEAPSPHFGIKHNKVLPALEGLTHDHEASVCIFGAQVCEAVLAVYWKLKNGLVEKHKSSHSPSATQNTSSRLFNALNLWK